MEQEKILSTSINIFSSLSLISLYLLGNQTANTSHESHN